jgi:hypothetical protein
VGWNHRVLESTEAGERSSGVYEVGYDESGRPTHRTENAMKPMGEDLQMLARELAMFRRALRKPVLSHKSFPRQVMPGLSRWALLRADITVSFYRIRRFCGSDFRQALARGASSEKHL